MIEFYRPIDCPDCAQIEAALKEMVIAHRVTILSPQETRPASLAGVSLPAFKEGGRVISGQSEILAYLKELESFVTTWRKFQSDACYGDE